MNYNSLMNKPTINYRELIGDNSVTEVGGITEEQFNTLLNTDLSSYYTKAQIDDLFSRSYVYREKSGSIVTFECPASVNGVNKVISEIVAVQSGTGDPSPTNVRPFTGWSAVNVYNDPIYGGTIDFNQLVPTAKKDFTSTYTDTRAYVSAVFRRMTSPYTPFLNKQISSTGNKNYIFKPNESVSCEFIHNGSSRNMVFIDSIGVTANHIYILLTDFTGVDTSTVGGVTITDMQLIDLTRVFGETKATEIYDMEQATEGTGVAYFKSLFYKDYYAYNTGEYTCVSAVNGDTYGLYTTALKDGQGNPMTCYGGTLTNENGVQTLDNTHNSFDMGSIGWGYTNYRFFAKIDDIWKNEQSIAPTENQLMCEIYKTAMYTNQPSGAVSTWSGYIYIRDDSYSGDVTAFKTAVAGYKIAYELATPQTIPQDSLSIATQEGTNNIWCDSGDITVKALDRIIQG